MHTVNDITGRGRYFITVHYQVISVEVLIHPDGDYLAYTDVSRSIPLEALTAVADCLAQIAARVAWLNERGAGAGKAATAVVSGDVTGVAV